MTRKIPTRERILDAAIDLMWRDGYDAVSVDTICAAAEIHKGSFYHAFPSKEELLVQAVCRVWDRDRPEIEAIHSSDLPPMKKLERHLAWFGESQARLQAKFGFVAGIFNMAIGINAPPAARKVIGERRQAHIGILHRAIGAVFDGQDVTEDQIAWWSLVASQVINGAIIEARLYDTLEPYEALPATVLAIIGLGPVPKVTL